jgi:hypothetical protein
VLHEVPASAIALMMRQARAANGDDIMPLSIEEEIRNGG